MSESSFFSRNGLQNGLQRSDFCLQNVETRQFEKDEEKLDLRFFLRKVWIFGRNRVSPLGDKLFFHDFNIRNMKNGNQNIRLSCPNNVSFHSEFMKKKLQRSLQKVMQFTCVNGRRLRGQDARFEAVEQNLHACKNRQKEKRLIV